MMKFLKKLLIFLTFPVSIIGIYFWQFTALYFLALPGFGGLIALLIGDTLLVSLFIWSSLKAGMVPKGSRLVAKLGKHPFFQEMENI